MKTLTIIAAGVLSAICSHGQNLILNSDFEAGNTNFSTQYTYAPEGMTAQGTYCVVTNPASVHNYWASFGDHTTGSGLMLVANGGSNPTNLIWRQTITVVTNTSYLFSAWAASSYSSSPSRFFFFVNGSQRGNPVTLPGTTGLWQNYSVIWDSQGSEEALLEIRMLNTSYGGNDFVLDDLSFRSVSSSNAPPPASIRKTAGEPPAVEVSWPAASNQLYQVQWTSEIISNQWFSLGPPLATNGITNAVIDPLGANLLRFYRVLPVN